MLHLLKRVVGVQRHDGGGKQQTGQKFKGSDALDALGEGLTRLFLGTLAARACSGAARRFRCVNRRGCVMCFLCHRRPSLGVYVRGACPGGGALCERAERIACVMPVAEFAFVIALPFRVSH